MQSLARTSTLGTSYSAAQVQSWLTQQYLTETWKFDRLNANLAYLNDLTPYVNLEGGTAQVQHDATAGGKRQASFEMRGDAPLNVLSDLIRVRYCIFTPDNGYIAFSLGIFTLTPWDKTIGVSSTWRKMVCPDMSQLLIDSTLTSTFTVYYGQSYVSAINSLVTKYGGITPISISIPDPGVRVPQNFSWQYGTTRLKVINDLLASINYWPAWFDENGVLRSSAKPDFNSAQPSFIFDTTGAYGPSIVMIPIKDKPDVAKIYNQCLVVVEDPRRWPTFATYINNQQGNPVSTVNWHPKVKVIKHSHLPFGTTAYSLARSVVQQSSLLFSTLEINTFPWPASQDYDFYQLIFNTQDEGYVNQKFMEAKWVHRCKTGHPTTHTFQRVYPT